MYKQQDQSNSSVDNLYRPIPQDCVAVRLNDYVHRYWKATLRTLTAERRQTAAHVLTEHFGFTVRQLSELFGCSRMTVYRDLRAVGSGQWVVGSGQWVVGSGQWVVGSGQ